MKYETETSSLPPGMDYSDPYYEDPYSHPAPRGRGGRGRGGGESGGYYDSAPPPRERGGFRGGRGGDRDFGRPPRGRRDEFGDGERRGRGPRGGRGIGNRRTEFRLVVRGMPPSGSWQDLKDHFREAGDVSFSDVFREHDGPVGVVEFINHADMTYALEQLDNTKFKSHDGEVATVKLHQDFNNEYGEFLVIWNC